MPIDDEGSDFVACPKHSGIKVRIGSAERRLDAHDGLFKEGNDKFDEIILAINNLRWRYWLFLIAAAMFSFLGSAFEPRVAALLKYLGGSK